MTSRIEKSRSTAAMKVFQPGKTDHKLVLKNRLVKSATYEAMATEKGYVTDKLIEFHEKIAKGGTGFIVTGLTCIQKNSRVFRNMTAIYDDTFFPGLKKLAVSIHNLDNDCKIAVQLCHAGRQIGPGGPEGAPVSPTSAKDKFTTKVPRMSPKRRSSKSSMILGKAPVEPSRQVLTRSSSIERTGTY